MAKLLVVQTVEHMVLSLNPAGGRIQLMNAWHFIAQSLLLSHFHSPGVF